MLLSCFAVLMLAALVLLGCGRLRAVGGLLVAAIIALLLVGSGVVPKFLLWPKPVGSRLADIPWTQHNSIVLLGGGTLAAVAGTGPDVPPLAFSRVATAAEAYFACRSRSGDCRIVASGGDPSRHGESESAVYARALEALHVPRGDLDLEDKSNNTRQNARRSTATIAQDRTVVIVTSGLALERALLDFSHYRQGVIGLASDRLDRQVGFTPSSMNMVLTDELLHEKLGRARDRLYAALGLEPS